MGLIEADKLIEICRKGWKLFGGEDEKLKHWVDEADIRNQPTVDAVPVVRCKDCVHNQLPRTSGNAVCELWYGMTDLYGYCSSGERRENE